MRAKHYHLDAALLSAVFKVAGPRQVSAAIGTPVAAQGEYLFLGFCRQKRADLREDFSVGIVQLGDRVVRTFTDTGAATVAFGRNYFSRLALRVVDCAVWTSS